MRIDRIVALMLAGTLLAAAAERFDLMRVDVRDDKDVRRLEAVGRVVNGPGPDGRWLVEVPHSGVGRLAAAGWNMELFVPDVGEFYRQNALDTRFHTYSEIKDSFMLMAANNPTFVRFETLGYASNDSLLFALRITDNVNLEEDEPELFFDGNVHGDEKTGSEALYAFAHELVEGYGVDPDITYWVDTREIWLQPIVNPYGNIAGVRSNRNGVDCNRNYGYMWDDWCGSGVPFSQPETRAHMDLSLRNAFSHWTSFHGGVTFISVPWSYTSTPPRDSAEIYYLSNEWRNITGYTVGRLYEIHGPSKDYAYGAHGGIGWTVESCIYKTPPAESLAPIIARESQAMKMMLANMDDGVRGIVTDTMTGAPVRARVTPMPTDFPCYCDTIGDYHRYLRPGTYDLVFAANGYATKTVTGVVVGTDSATRIDVMMVPDTTMPVTLHRTVICNVDEDETIRVTPDYALGVHDGKQSSLSAGGWLVMDFGQLVYNLPGNDFTVFEEDGDPEGYEVLVANEWQGPWQSLGSDTGTAGFDLSDADISFCRYVRIVDDGGSSSGPTAGFDLDAIEAVMYSAAAVVMNNQTIIDSPPGGNGDGKLDPGEYADLVLELKNVGRLVAESIVGTLATDDTLVSVLDSSGVFGTIHPDSVRINNGDRFELSAAAGTPREHTARMRLRLVGAGYEDSLEFSVVVGELRAVDSLLDGPRQPALYWAYDDVDSGVPSASRVRLGGNPRPRYPAYAVGRPDGQGRSAVRVRSVEVLRAALHPGLGLFQRLDSPGQHDQFRIHEHVAAGRLTTAEHRVVLGRPPRADRRRGLVLSRCRQSPVHHRVRKRPLLLAPDRMAQGGVAAV